MRILILLLIIVPALEIGLLILSGNTLGVWPTILLIIFTGFLGAFLAKRQGLEVINQVQRQLAMGQIPGNTIVEGVCVLVGGILLLTPGFITDVTGFLLLFPATRVPFRELIKKIIKRMADNGQFFIMR